MWWTDYIRAVKRQLRDKYGFKPLPGSAKEEPFFKGILDGEYPMEIEGKTDKVRVSNGKISYYNFE